MSLWQKKLNQEKPKPLKIQTLTKNVDIGLPIKTNDITGSLSYITNISLTNISVELIESSNPWLPLLKPEKLNNADHITKKWKKNINFSLRFSWVSGYKITILKTMSLFFLTYNKKVTVFWISRSWVLNSWEAFLRHPAHNKNKPKSNPEPQKWNSKNPKSQHWLSLQVILASIKFLLKNINSQNMKYLEIFHLEMTTSTISLTTPTKETSEWVISSDQLVKSIFWEKRSLWKHKKSAMLTTSFLMLFYIIYYYHPFFSSFTQQNLHFPPLLTDWWNLNRLTID